MSSQRNSEDEYDRDEGSINLGHKYEYAIAALIALRLCLEDEINDFKMSLHNKKYGKFDDIVFEYDQRERDHSIALQLKHSNKTITKEALGKEFKMYLESALKYKLLDSGVILVLFTSRNIDSRIKVILDAVESKAVGCSKLDVIEATSKNDVITKLLNTGDELCNYLKTFRSQNDAFFDFCNSFKLFYNQASLKNVRQIINNEARKRITDGKHIEKDIGIELPSFVENWVECDRSSRYKLSKESIILSMLENILDPYIIHPESFENGDYEVTNVWIEILLQFKITIINTTISNTAIYDRLIEIVKHKLNLPISERSNAMPSGEKRKLVEHWKSGNVPLIMESKQHGHLKVIDNCIDYAKKVERSFVIFTDQEVLIDDLKNKDCLTRLIHVQQFRELFSKLLEQKIEIQNRFTISLETILKYNEEEIINLPIGYILKLTVLQKTDRQVQPEEYISRKLKKLNLGYISEEMDVIEGSIIQEKDLFMRSRDEKIICIVGDPGMGKTRLMKNYHDKCPKNYWCVLINCPLHSSIFDQELGTVEDLPTIVKGFVKYDEIEEALFKSFLQMRKIVVLWDGLDEVSNLKNALKIIQILFRKKIHQWITIRTHLKENIHDSLQPDVDFFQLEQLSKSNKNHLIEKLVHGSHGKANQILQKMSKQTKEIDNLMANPLYLTIFCKLISSERLPLRHFDISDLFEIFTSETIKNRFELDTTSTFAYNYLFRRHVNVSVNHDLLATTGYFTSPNIFSHHIFCEYFASKFLAEQIMINSKSLLPRAELASLHDVIEKVSFQPKYRMLYRFLNGILTKNHDLHRAVLNTDLTAIQSLIKKSRPSEDCGGRTPLHLAAQITGRTYEVNGTPHFKILSQIIDVLSGANIDVHTSKDNVLCYTPSQYALHMKNFVVLDYFLRKCQPNTISFDFQPSDLRKILMDGCVEILEYLITEKHLNLTHLEPLHIAAGRGFMRMIKLFLLHKVNVNSTDSKGRTPLMHAVWKGHSKIVKFLLSHEQIRVDAESNSGEIALHTAAKLGRLNILERLILKNSNINATNNNKQTPIFLAIKNRHYAVVQTLLENEADVDIRDKNGMTPLHIAASSGAMNCVQILIRSSDVNCRTILEKKSRTAKTFIANGVLNFAPNILDHATPLYVATQSGHLDVVELLIQAGADEKCLSNYGCTLLHAAVSSCSEETMKYLIESKRHDINVADNNDDTLLHIAAGKGFGFGVKELVKKEVDVNALNKNKLTPLDIAVCKKHLDIVKTLIGENAIVNNLNIRGNTTLHEAVLREYIDITKALLIDCAPPIKRALVNSKNAEGNTVFKIASGSPDMIRALLNYLPTEHMTPDDRQLLIRMKPSSSSGVILRPMKIVKRKVTSQNANYGNRQYIFNKTIDSTKIRQPVPPKKLSKCLCILGFAVVIFIIILFCIVLIHK